MRDLIGSRRHGSVEIGGIHHVGGDMQFCRMRFLNDSRQQSRIESLQCIRDVLILSFFKLVGKHQDGLDEIRTEVENTRPFLIEIGLRINNEVGMILKGLAGVC